MERELLAVSGFILLNTSDGSVERFKARLVAKGYTQSYGIDYLETFAPVAQMGTVRILLSIAVNKGWPLHQLNVKNAFLHGDLTEEIYMDIPPGYNQPGSLKKVCRLKKTLYGLKQSPGAWFGRLTRTMKMLGFLQAQCDHTLFYKRSSSGGVTILLVYVDDMIVTGNNLLGIDQLQDQLKKEFEIKALGQLKYFLGIEVAHRDGELFLSQRKYITDLLNYAGMQDCKPASTPIVAKHCIGSSPISEKVDKGQYQCLVGKLIYLSNTRPDISYAVGILSQFMHDPRMIHRQAAQRVLAYLKGTTGMGILYKRQKSLPLIYTPTLTTRDQCMIADLQLDMDASLAVIW